MSDYMQQRAEIVEDFCPTCHYAQCRCDETILTGRYDHEEHLQKWLRKAYQLRQACIASEHKSGKLDYNPSTNVMTCGNCALEMDMNELVSPELRVRRYVA